MPRIAGFWARHKGKKIEKFGALLVPAILLLVALSAFGLGRLSAFGGGEGGLTIIMPDGSPAGRQGYTQTAAVQESARTFVASKSGTKYYLPSCSGASRIKEENKVWFATAAQAQAAGYGPASGCAGL